MGRGGWFKGRHFAAAKRFFRKALARPHTVNPRTITVDRNLAYPRATTELKRDGELWRRSCVVSGTVAIEPAMSNQRMILDRLSRERLPWIDLSYRAKQKVKTFRSRLMKLRLTAYATRLPFVHQACCAFALLLIIFSVWPETDPDHVPPSVFTYTYAIILFAICAALLGSRRILNVSDPFLFAPLVLALIGGASLAYSRISGPPSGTSYGAGLIPLLVCGLPILVSTNDIEIDYAKMSKFIVLLLCLASGSHLVWQLLDVGGLQVFPSHERTFTFCFLMLLAGFARQWHLVALAMVATFLSLLLRPSSTLFLCTVLSMGSIILYTFMLRWSVRLLTCVVIVLVLVINIGALFSADFARSVYSVEPGVKESVLESETNTEFRLGVIEAARQEALSNSIIFGKFFAGDVSPRVSSVLPWWPDASGSDYAPVHSDFVALFRQGGLTGYTLFAILFLGFAHLCIEGARLSAALGNTDIESFFDAVLVMEAVFVIYITFNPIMQKPCWVVFFFMFVPLCVFLVRDARSVAALSVRPGELCSKLGDGEIRRRSARACR